VAVVGARGRVVRKMVERGRECVGVLEAVGECDEEEGKTRDGLHGCAFIVTRSDPLVSSIGLAWGPRTDSQPFKIESRAIMAPATVTMQL